MENIQRDNADILDAVWAALAQTVIPPQPVSGQAYRNPAVEQAVIQLGQKFNSVADSALFNQFLYLLSNYVVAMGQRGILPWISAQKYREGGLCLGPDGSLWQAQTDIDAGDTTVPGTDTTRWDVPLMNGKKGVSQATEEIAGIAKIATAADVAAGTDNTKIITPETLANALLPTWNGVLNQKDSGYVRFPGGALIQWASDSRNIGGQPTVVTFPLPFVSEPFVVLSAFQGGILDTSAYLRQRTPTTFTFVAMNNGEITPNTNGVGVFWLAIGEGA